MLGPKYDFPSFIAGWAHSEKEHERGWISVSDRLPENNVEVLIAFRDTSLPATGQYTANDRDTWGWCFPGENDPEDTGPITHWMLLPTHPNNK